MTVATMTFAEKMTVARAKKHVPTLGHTFDTKNENGVKNLGRKTRFVQSSMDGAWSEMASARGIRLPAHNAPCTPAGMRRWLRRTGLDMHWFKDYTGLGTLPQWIERNPTWGLRSWAGLLIEETQP